MFQEKHLISTKCVYKPFMKLSLLLLHITVLLPTIMLTSFSIFCYSYSASNASCKTNQAPMLFGLHKMSTSVCRILQKYYTFEESDTDATSKVMSPRNSAKLRISIFYPTKQLKIDLSNYNHKNIFHQNYTS